MKCFPTIFLGSFNGFTCENVYLILMTHNLNLVLIIPCYLSYEMLPCRKKTIRMNKKICEIFGFSFPTIIILDPVILQGNIISYVYLQNLEINLEL